MFETKSVSSRFSVSFVFNLFRLGLTLATTILLARFLGAEDYGRLAFLLASFLAFKTLIDMSSANAFFTFLSKETRSKSFIRIYWFWMAFQLFFPLFLLGFVLPDGVLANIWLNESRSLVILALIATFMQQSAWQVASQMAEAQRETMAIQGLSNIVVLCHLAAIIFLNFFNLLTLPIILIVLSVEWALAAFLAYRLYSASDEKSDTLQSVLSEFWSYCKPLIPFGWLVAACEFLDRWMLQLWGGSAEQAYYAVASNLSTIVILASVSVIKILWKEFAEAYHQDNMDLLKALYERWTRIIFFISSFISGVCIAWSDTIVDILLGSDYSGGKVAFLLMMIYPVHQCLGQINGVLLFATEKTKLQAIIGSIFTVVSLFTSYYFLAPADAFIPGLHLGSEGLALKMLIMNFVAVNALGYVISRKFNWKYKWFFQFYILAGVIALGYFSKYLVLGIFSSVYLSIVLSFIIYSLIVAFLVYCFPSLTLGITRSELNRFTSKISF